MVRASGPRLTEGNEKMNMMTKRSWMVAILAAAVALPALARAHDDDDDWGGWREHHHERHHEGHRHAWRRYYQPRVRERAVVVAPEPVYLEPAPRLVAPVFPWVSGIGINLFLPLN